MPHRKVANAEYVQNARFGRIEADWLSEKRAMPDFIADELIEATKRRQLDSFNCNRIGIAIRNRSMITEAHC